MSPETVSRLIVRPATPREEAEGVGLALVSSMDIVAVFH
jgi:hypothetical protein